jgi:hypothetical protein
MGAIDPARAINDRAGENARFAQHFKCDTRADDIDNRINRADFVEVDFLGRHAVDFAFGIRDTLENGYRLLFHPIGQLALGDQLFDFGEGALVVVTV